MRHIVWVLATCVISSPLYAQESETVFIRAVPFLRHGVWNAIALNAGAEFRMVFAPKENSLRANSPISSGPADELYAQLTVTQVFGAGPQTTMDFTGLYYGHTIADAKGIGDLYGMPGADVVCGTLFGPSEEFTCFLFDMILDGYIPGSSGSKLYNIVLPLKIIIDGELVFDGEMRNRIPLRITDDGTVIW